jgi:hypothetical protein
MREELFALSESLELGMMGFINEKTDALPKKRASQPETGYIFRLTSGDV